MNAFFKQLQLETQRVVQTPERRTLSVFSVTVTVQIKGLFYLAAFHHRNCCCLHFCRSSLSLTLLRVPSYFLLTGGGSPGVTVVVMMSLLLIPASFTFPFFKPAPIFRTYQGLFSGLKRCIKSSPEVDQVLFRDSVQTCLLSYKSSRL